MPRILVTGAAVGLGFGAATELVEHGHEVLVHVRSLARADGVRLFDEPSAHLVTGDLATLDGVHELAEQVAAAGPVDAIIHNAGVLDGPAVLPVNVVAPYLLSALVPARRLVFLSSSMHRGGTATLDGLDWSGTTRTASYSDSKLLVTVLAAAIARVRPGVFSNAVDPGWVPTRMGGPNAPDDLELGHRTQVALAEGRGADTSGYWHHQRREEPHRAVHDEAFQDELLLALAEHTGVPLLP
ncbi:SDR family NAD(P)-dependent oxidoreductase [Plantibacter sp. VKM Ac-2876]|uniref:SDR family NAD(P)-dependent oxidoreductase n=1 Tax=Plantibacter sp. VKM Ac-2876 TaxID=2783826 RepID=UPI00188D8698|nr:SDR family NAD(P)-dependent oxidoreductase [Plantibacter sp. VKM Ac-2876]MBF4565885.1 SDR family NAD(P)-dependent oxidoreductase [Plantibacter sp. VKM Ac-2876]